MGNKEILILDEPTTGLDPLMRDAFLELVKEEKAKGRTIFMSSHIFQEIEDVCDKVAMIKDGKIVDTIDLWNLRHWKTKTFDITFSTPEDYKRFITTEKTVKSTDDAKLKCLVELPADDINRLLATLKGYSVAVGDEGGFAPHLNFGTIFQTNLHEGRDLTWNRKQKRKQLIFSQNH